MGLLVSLALLAGIPAARAQDSPRLALGAHLATVQVDEFDARDTGFGARLTWSPLDLLGVDAEVTFFPDEFPGGDDRRAFSRRRVEALFGVTLGPRLGWIRPFALGRAGVVRYDEASGPLACIAIFPPPLSCVLAAGDTLPAFDVGGGIALFPSRRTFVRVDVSDRIVRYPGPAYDGNLQRRDGDFTRHEPRVAVAAGVRFW